jgi:hypothetical protein
MNVPMFCMAKLVTEVKPPINIEAGNKQELSIPKTMIQTTQPDAAPVFAFFMISPMLYGSPGIPVIDTRNWGENVSLRRTLTPIPVSFHGKVWRTCNMKMWG